MFTLTASINCTTPTDKSALLIISQLAGAFLVLWFVFVWVCLLVCGFGFLLTLCGNQTCFDPSKYVPKEVNHNLKVT